MQKLPDKIVFVDIETTGVNSQRDRVIEIGVVRMEQGRVVRTWNSLVDPGTYLPPEITSLTGIRASDLNSAPSFRQIADILQDLLEDCVFSAHNARFDYSFLKSEFKRLGVSLSLKQLCTVKLSRQMFSRFHNHNLDALIDRHGLSVKNRHRALDDADAIRQFYELIVSQTPLEKLSDIVQKILRHPSAPTGLDHLKINSLPEKPGVYIFYGSSGMPLYVGKSINIKNRVLSHFTAGLSDPGDMRLFSEVVSIDHEVCGGELGALLREAVLVKQLQPLHNRRLRIVDQLFIVNRDSEIRGYRTVSVTVNTMPGIDTVGIFRSKKDAEQYLDRKCRENILCQKLFGLEKVRDRCFDSDLDRCSACTYKEPVEKYNLRFDLSFAGDKFPDWPFTGPVIITEGRQSFIINNWCCVGAATGDVWTQNDLHFDLDAFNILRRFILNSKNQKFIKPVTGDRVGMLKFLQHE